MREMTGWGNRRDHAAIMWALVALIVNYRVIYRFDDQKRLVTVIAIEHRSDIYRPREA